MSDKVLAFINQKFSCQNHEEIRKFLLALWDKFSQYQLADSSFVSEFVSGQDNKFYQRYSEMLLASFFLEKGIEISSQDEGPDLKLKYNNQTVWVEIICPEPKGIPEDYLKLPPKDPNQIRCVSVPDQEILMRWTSAIKEKYEKLEGFQKNDQRKQGYIEKGIVKKDDIYIIAVNSYQLTRRASTAFWGISQHPYAVEATLAVGPIEIKMDYASGQVLSEGNSCRRYILKPNRSQIPTDNFLNPNYQNISAVLAFNAGLDAVNQHFPCGIVHNPLTCRPLSQGMFDLDFEYITTRKPDYWEIQSITSKIRCSETY